MVTGVGFALLSHLWASGGSTLRLRLVKREVPGYGYRAQQIVHDFYLCYTQCLGVYLLANRTVTQQLICHREKLSLTPENALSDCSTCERTEVRPYLSP